MFTGHHPRLGTQPILSYARTQKESNPHARGIAQSQPTGFDALPPDVEQALRQVRGVFSYKTYRLIEAITMRGRNNKGAGVSGDLPDYSHYDFSYERVRIAAETPHTIHIDSHGGFVLAASGVGRAHDKRLDEAGRGTNAHAYWRYLAGFADLGEEALASPMKGVPTDHPRFGCLMLV